LQGCATQVDRLLKEGYAHVVDADLKSCFDTIPHDRLLAQVASKVSDGRVLDLIKGFLCQDVMKAMEQWTPTTGTPQGAVISPLLANIYLHPLDLLMEQSGYRMVRYADDFVILCGTAEESSGGVAPGYGVDDGERLDAAIRRRLGSVTRDNRARDSISWAIGSRAVFGSCARKA